METHQIVVEHNPSRADMDRLSEQLSAYNVSRVGIDDGRDLAVFLRDAQGQLVGGLHGWTWAGMAYIAIFWITEALRGQGYGKQILLTAEQEARTRGCDRIWLNSFSFQAPEFYQQCGYTVFSVLEDFPRQHQWYFLQKSL
jgi:GNAT superfamily N-acetyltransferase